MSTPENVRSLPVLPIKNTVLFPYMLMPLTVGRASSKAVIEAALGSEEKELIVVSQRDASVDNPTLNDLYSIGTRAVIRNMNRKADGTLEVVLLGVERAVLLKLEPQGAYNTARTKPLPLPPEKNPETEALRREVG